MLDMLRIFDPDLVEARVRTRCLRFESPDDLPGDWRIWWEERAAIMEYDGGLPRERAEAVAWDEVLNEMERAGDHKEG